MPIKVRIVGIIPNTGRKINEQSRAPALPPIRSKA